MGKVKFQVGSNFKQEYSERFPRLASGPADKLTDLAAGMLWAGAAFSRQWAAPVSLKSMLGPDHFAQEPFCMARMMVMVVDGV